jgi:integrase
MPYKRTYKAKDGTTRVSFYTDIRLRKNGEPTGGRLRKLIPLVKNMTEARKAESKIAQSLLYGEEYECPMLSDFLETTYLTWARENKKRPERDEPIVKTLCASPALRGRRLDEISVIQIEGYKRERRNAQSRWKRAYKPATLNCELSILSRAFRLAVDAGLCRSNPVRLTGRLDVDAPPFRVLLPEEEPSLWAALADGPEYLLPLARLALLTGLREGELLALEKSAVDFRRDLLFVVNPKWRLDKRKTEGLPFGQDARALLLRLCARTEGLLFSDRGKRLSRTAVFHLFKRRTQKAGIMGLKFHSLRHTFGSRLADAGRSPYEIARLMGHADIKTSMVYVHPDKVRLREALECVPSSNSSQWADTKVLGVG